MSRTDLSREGLLALVRRAYQDHDPVPDDLVARMQAVVAAEVVLADTDLDYELMLLVDRSTELAGARGTAAYTLRFTHDEVDLLVRAVTDEDGRTRLDGWLAPPVAVTVRAVGVPDQGSPVEVSAGADGRFEITGLAPGMYRLFLTPTDSGFTPFGTPAFEI